METSPPSSTARGPLLMAIAFFGIFVYGLLTALPGTVIPDLERSKFLPDDAVVGSFLRINAIGAILAYVVSGPLTDKLGKKFTLAMGAILVIASMIGFGFVVQNVQPSAAKFLI